MDHLRHAAFSIQRWLNQPQRVFMTCFTLLLVTLFLNGTLWKLWGLYRDEDRIVSQSLEAKAQMLVIDKQIKQAADTTFIERQARDKMDLVGDHDLIFVFPE
jgi:hypothetical protein